jgi:hypothetical protein
VKILNGKIKLRDVVKVLRSKNAGPFKLVIDIFFKERETYEKVKSSGVINKKLVAKNYRISESMVEGIYFVDTVLGVKITMLKKVASDDISATDVYGAQQHAPMLEVEIDV